MSENLTRRSLLLLSLGGLLAGCGFRPLYGRKDGGRATTDYLAATRIAPLPDRKGQILHNLLRDRLNPLGQPDKPVYELKVALAESIRDLGVLEDETASRASLTLTLTFTLVELASGKTVTTGSTVAVGAYDILDNRYASSVAEEDARNRAYVQLADDVRLRLSIYFASQGV